MCLAQNVLRCIGKVLHYITKGCVILLFHRKKSLQCRNLNNIFCEGALGPPARVWKSSLFLNPQSWQANNEEVDQSCPAPGVLDCSHSLGCNSTQLLGSNSPFNDVVTEEAIKVLCFIRGLLFILFLSEKRSELFFP